MILREDQIKELEHHIGNGLMVIGGFANKYGYNIELDAMEVHLGFIRNGVVNKEQVVHDANKLAIKCSQTDCEAIYSSGARISKAVCTVLMPVPKRDWRNGNDWC